MIDRLVDTSRKLPRQARSRAMVAAILDAATRILVEGGYESLSTNLAAERAGVSIGSFYQYFPNKYALLLALHQRHIEQTLEAGAEILSHTEDRSLPVILKALIRAVVASHTIEPELHRVLEEEVPKRILAPNMDRAGAGVRLAVRSLLERHRSTIVVDDLDRAAFVLTQTIETNVHAAVRERPSDLFSSALEQDLVRMLSVYLCGKGDDSV